jgi:crossover junction endodeoxyribonuclease RusA
MSVSFVAAGTAAPQGSKTRTKWGMRESSKAIGPWRDRVAKAAYEAMVAMDGVPVLDGPVAVEMTIWLPRPKKHFGKRGLLPSAPKYPTTTPDIDKVARGILDAITGIVIRSDAQVVDLCCQKLYSEPARVDVVVTPLVDTPGLVDRLGL